MSIPCFGGVVPMTTCILSMLSSVSAFHNHAIHPSSFSIKSGPLLPSISTGIGIGSTDRMILRSAPSILFMSATDEASSASSSPSQSRQQSESSPTSASATSTDNDAASSAEYYRAKARELLGEANAMEARLRESKLTSAQIQIEEADALILQLLTLRRERKEKDDDDITSALRDKSPSLNKMKSVIVRLHERDVRARGGSSSATAKTFMIGDARNGVLPEEEEEGETDRYSTLVESILRAQEMLDEERILRRSGGAVVFAPPLRSEWNELRRAEQFAFQKRLEQNGKMSVTTDSATFVKGDERSLHEFITSSATSFTNRTGNKITVQRNLNTTQLWLDMMSVPMWVPSNILGLVVTAKGTITKNDIQTLREQIISTSSFFVTDSQFISRAAIFRGNFLLPKDSNVTRNAYASMMFREASRRLELNVELRDRVQMFLAEDPEWRPNQDDREEEPKPVFLIVPKSMEPVQSNERSIAARALIAASTLATIFTIFVFSVSSYSLNPAFFNSIIEKQDDSLIGWTLPIFLGTILLQILHEVGHLVAAKYHNVTLGMPIFLPSLQIGTFGNITPIRSFPPTKSSLLDIALSGPGVTLLCSIGLLILSLCLTVNTPTDMIASLPVMPAALLRSSFFIGSVTSLITPKLMTLPLSQPIPVHPLFFVSLSGLFSSGLNLLPIGKLDGGRAATAVFGRRPAYLISILTLVFLAAAALTKSSVISIFWGGLVVLFQRNEDVRVRDEVGEVEDWRFGTYFGILVLVGLVLAPFPGGIML